MTTKSSLQDHVAEKGPAVAVPSGLMTTLLQLNHDQLPGILLHDEAAASRGAPACLVALGSGCDEPDSDLSVFPTAPPVAPGSAAFAATRNAADTSTTAISRLPALTIAMSRL
jgi:hypothetical protein